MKIAIRIIGVLEVEFERNALNAQYPCGTDSVDFFKACISHAASEAIRLDQATPRTLDTTANQ